jgi:His-Xaa-Ser system protein HxsD
MPDPMPAQPDAVLTLDAVAHPADVVQRAAYRFSDILTVEVGRDGDVLTCKVYARDPERLGAAVHDLRAEIVDQVLRARIRDETRDLRNLVLAVAFSRTGLAGSEA